MLPCRICRIICCCRLCCCRRKSEEPGTKPTQAPLGASLLMDDGKVRSVANEGETMQEFVWKSSTPGVQKVILTGIFDEWKETIEMAPDAQDKSKFSAKVPLDPKKTWKFKFLVDGEWKCSSAFATATGEDGTTNNVIYGTAPAQ